MKWKNLAKLVPVFIFIIFGVYFMKAGFWRVQSVNCRQDGQPCSFDIWSGLFSQLKSNNWLTLSGHNLEKKLENDNPVFTSVAIHKTFPNIVSVEIISRQPTLAALKDGKTYLMDSDGFVLGVSAETPDLPRFHAPPGAQYIPGEVAPDTISLFSARLLTECQWRSLNPIMAEASGRWSVSVEFTDNFMADFSSQKDLGIQLDSLQFILNRTKMEGKLPARVDLRFDKPVIVE